MLRPTVLILAIACVGDVARCEDSFSSILREATHVGLAVNERLSSYDVHFYSEKQFRENVAALKQHRGDLEEYGDRRAKLDQERRDAHERRAPVQELNAITRKRSHLRKPHSDFAGRIGLYTVAGTGTDYLKLHPHDSSQRTVLVPFAMVGRVFVTEDSGVDDRGNADSEPSDATERRSRTN